MSEASETESAPAGSSAVAWAGRVARSVLGAMVGAVVAAVLDGRYADEARTQASGPSLVDLAVAAAGLVAPVALVTGLLVGAALVFLRPRDADTPSTLGALLRDPRGERAAAALLAGPSAALCAVLLAQIARRGIGLADTPKSAGALLGLWAIALSVGAFTLTRGAARRLGPLLSRVQPLAHPAGALTASLLLAAAIIGAGIAQGTTGGEGGLLAIMGVLKRPELDLRAPGLLALIAASAAAAPGALKRLFGPVAFSLSLAPLVLTLSAAKALDGSQSLTASIERAPLSKVGLRILRRLTDADRDGASRTFGGGDCNDRDARVFPTAIDEPGNGIDEDCSGSDAKPPEPEPVAPPTPTAKAPAASAPEGLSVLLISVDTLRAELGFTGYQRPISPSLDALAARSVVFETAYSLASYTGKSIGPMMSGKYPSETHRGWSHFNPYPKDDIMVAERLKDAGIKTMSVQAHWYFDKCCGMHRGFDVVDLSSAPPPGTQIDADTSSTSDKITDAAIKRLSTEVPAGGRFFAWVHYLDPHADYLRHPDTPDFGRGARDLYDHEIAFTDKHIGRLLAWIDQQPFAGKVAVIVTSDHGEAFGEHKLIRHGFEVWEELVRVPLIVSVPGAKPARVKARRSLIDLVPTILDLYRLEPKFGSTKFDFVSGKSLLPDVFAADAAETRDIFVDMPAGPNNDERRAFYHGDRKLYVSSGVSYQLFDLAADPGEKSNLADSDKEGLADMRARYDTFRGKLREVRVKPEPK